jgi:hypothetical protein
MERYFPRSLIWNNTWSNKYIVQKHSFWEVRNGSSTLLQEDSWQQEKIISYKVSLRESQTFLLNKGCNIVNHYWEEDNESPLRIYHSWISIKDWLIEINEKSYILLDKILSSY